MFDAAGQGALPDSIELRGGTSRIVTIADPEAFRLGVPFSGEAARDAETLAEVARQAAAGTVAETYPLEEAPAAHAVVDTGHGRGKVVLLVDEPAPERLRRLRALYVGMVEMASEALGRTVEAGELSRVMTAKADER